MQDGQIYYNSSPWIKSGQAGRAGTIYRYTDMYRYRLGRYRIDTLGCRIVILSEILLAANLVVSNLKIYIQVHSILTV